MASQVDHPMKQRSRIDVSKGRKMDGDQHLVLLFTTDHPVARVLWHLNNEYAKCQYPLFFGQNKTRGGTESVNNTFKIMRNDCCVE